MVIIVIVVMLSTDSVNNENGKIFLHKYMFTSTVNV